MHVATLELCKELYELSGWETDQKVIGLASGNKSGRYYAYDLGYLLRKLPNSTDIDANLWDEKFDSSVPDCWFLARNMDNMDHEWRIQMQIEESVIEGTLFEADTPEDACAKLCIELIKQGILKHEKPKNHE